MSLKNNRLAKLYDRKAAVIAEMKSIVEVCNRDGRERLTKEQDHRFEFLKSEAESLSQQIEQERSRRETELHSLTSPIVQVGDDDPCGTAERRAGINPLYRNVPKMATTFSDIYKQQRAERGTLAVAEPPSQWVDTHTGETVEVLSADERLSSEGDERQLHFGKLIKGLVASKWDNADHERQYLAQGGNVNVAGGVLVNAELSTGFIDKVRAAMVTLRAGAKTIPMQSDVLRIARVTTDPTFTVKAENDSFPSTQVAFDAIQFSPRTIGAVIAMSRELVEDAPNVTELIESVLSKALAVKLDSLALTGTGSAQPLGLLNYPGITSTGSIGTVAWSHTQTACTAIRNANIEPSCYICNPTDQNRLASLVTGDGTNAAKNWLPPPSNVASLEQLVTTSMTVGSMVFGDFTRLMFGLRSEARVEVSTEAGTSFAAHQALVKITTRWDVNVEHVEAFYLLTGISG